MLGATVLMLLLTRLPFVRRSINYLLRPFGPFITLDEASAILSHSTNSHAVSPNDGRADSPRSSTEEIGPPDATRQKATIGALGAAMSIFGLFATSAWLAVASYQAITIRKPTPVIILDFASAFAWLYVMVRPLARPLRTTPVDVLVLGLCLFVLSGLEVGLAGIDRLVFENQPVRWTWLEKTRMIVNCTSCAISAVAVFCGGNLPMASSPEAGEEVSSPEDIASFWCWIRFSWPAIPKVSLEFVSSCHVLTFGLGPRVPNDCKRRILRISVLPCTH